MNNKQVIVPDDFYDCIESIESGESKRVEVFLADDVLFLVNHGELSSLDVFYTLMKTDFNLMNIDLVVTEMGTLIVSKANTFYMED